VANFALTEVAITGDIEELNELVYIMGSLECMKKPAIKNGFGKTWLGCLVEALGSSWQEVSCRGEWSCLERHADHITFCTESAWSAPTEVLDLIQKKFPSFQVFFLSTEPGCDYFVTNDTEGRFFPDRYIVDMCTVDGDYQSEYFEDLESALEWTWKQTGAKVDVESDVVVLNEELAAQNPDAFCYLHKIEVV
jgi:hypothetical protein